MALTEFQEVLISSQHSKGVGLDEQWKPTL